MNDVAAHVPPALASDPPGFTPTADPPAGERAAAEPSTAVLPGSPAISELPGVPWSFAHDVAASGPPSSVEPVDEQGQLPLWVTGTSRPPLSPAPSFGPIGRHRSPLLVALRATVTLGVYALVWHRSVNREMEEFDPKLHARPGRSTLAVLLPWMLGLLVTMAGALLIVAPHLGLQVPYSEHVTDQAAMLMLLGLVAVPYLVLAIPFSAIAVTMTLERLRSVEEHAGVTPDRQVRAVGSSLRLLLPVVGGLALIAMEQRRLNAVWSRFTPSAGYPL